MSVPFRVKVSSRSMSVMVDVSQGGRSGAGGSHRSRGCLGQFGSMSVPFRDKVSTRLMSVREAGQRS